MIYPYILDLAILKTFIILNRNNNLKKKQPMKKLIPLNNDVDKLMAFIPSLNPSWRSNQRITSSPHQIESLDVINSFKEQGWRIAGAYEKLKNGSRKVGSHFIEMTHPDFMVKNKKGQTEAVANISIQNSCNGSKPLEIDLGAFRQVCSNGLVAHTSYSSYKLRHTEKNKNSLYDVLCLANSNAAKVIEEFNKMKHYDMSPSQMVEFAVNAAKIRFGDDYNMVDISQLLKVVRSEDEGSDLWTVFNRVQENLTQSDRIVDVNGAVVSGLGVEEDLRVNKELYSLVELVGNNN